MVQGDIHLTRGKGSVLAFSIVPFRLELPTEGGGVRRKSTFEQPQRGTARHVGTRYAMESKVVARGERSIRLAPGARA